MAKVRIRSLTGRPELVGHLLVSHEASLALELDEALLPKALPQLVKDGKVKVTPVLNADSAASVAEEPKRAEPPKPKPEKRQKKAKKAKAEAAPAPEEPKPEPPVEAKEEAPSEEPPAPDEADEEKSGDVAGD